MKKTLFIIILFAFVAKIWAQPQTFKYATHKGQDLFMDVYQPDHPRADKACVIYVYGGGFFEGERNSDFSAHDCKTLAGKGYVVMAIDYRLGLKGVSFDTIRSLPKIFNTFHNAITIAVEDLASATRYAIDHSSELGIDTSKIIVTGCSAGAITVLQTDYCRANNLMPTRELPAKFKYAAVVSYSGAVYSRDGRPRYDTPPSPTFFLHGGKDKVVTYKGYKVFNDCLAGSKWLARTFRNNGYPHWFATFDEVGHEVAMCLSPSIEEFDAFVNNTLNGRKMHYTFHCKDNDLKPGKFTKMNIFKLYHK